MVNRMNVMNFQRQQHELTQPFEGTSHSNPLWVNIKIFAALLLSLFALIAQPAYAVETKASVSTTKVASGEMFRFRVSVEAMVSGDSIDLTPLEKDFSYSRVQYGTRSYNMNGKVSRRTEWNMTLVTTKTGQVEIPSLDINGDKTKPIQLTVSQGAPLPKTDDLVEVINTIDKDSLYIGETAKITTKLLIKTDPYSLQDPQLTAPKSKDVTIKALGRQNQLATVIDGVDTIMITQDYQITPKNTGEITIDPMTLKVGIIDRTSNSRRMIPVDIQAKPLKLNVLGKPGDYQGAWLPTSSLRLMQTWTDGEGKPLEIKNGTFNTKVGVPLTRTIRLTVKDLSSDKFPKLAIYYPKGVRVYDEKPKFDRDTKGNTIMTVTQVVMPRESGQVNLPSVEVPWWDTQSRSKQLATADGIQLEVKPDPNAPVQTSQPTKAEPQKTQAPSNNQPQQALENEPKTQASQNQNEAPKAQSATDIQHNPIWMWIAALLAGLWLITFVLWLNARRQTKVTTQPIASKSSANTTDMTELKSALAQNDGMKISLWMQSYFANSTLASAQKQAIQIKLDRIMQGLYGQSAQADEKDKNELIKAIEQAKSGAQKLEKEKLATL